APAFSILLGRFFFSSRRRHTRSKRDWSSDVCSSDLCLSMLVIPGLLGNSHTPHIKPLSLHTMSSVSIYNRLLLLRSVSMFAQRLYHVQSHQLNNRNSLHIRIRSFFRRSFQIPRSTH